jgi:hypothetical protein
MLYSIDELSFHKSMVFCSGWFSRDHLSRCEIYISNSGHILTPTITAKKRPDVASIHGRNALWWGFELRCILNDGSPDALRELTIVVINGGNEVRIMPLSSNARRQARLSLDQCLEHFFTEVNSKSDAKILEIGSRARSGIVRKSLFNKIQYIGLDIMEGPNVDVVGDAHRLSEIFPKNEFDFIYSISTFEHLLMPWKVAVEMNSVMKRGGFAFIQSHQSWPIHDEPWDYFRFSKYSWLSLFNASTGYEVIHAVHGDPASILSITQSEDFSTFLEDQPSYLSSACLVKKIKDADVDWDINPNDIVKNGYPV